MFPYSTWSVSDIALARRERSFPRDVDPTANTQGQVVLLTCTRYSTYGNLTWDEAYPYPYRVAHDVFAACGESHDTTRYREYHTRYQVPCITAAANSKSRTAFLVFLGRADAGQLLGRTQIPNGRSSAASLYHSLQLLCTLYFSWCMMRLWYV